MLCEHVHEWHYNKTCWSMLGGLPEQRDSATRWPFTSPAACSIFNVSQLTAALAGSLVRNASHASAAAWQAHASCCRALWPTKPNSVGAAGGLRCWWLSVALLGWPVWYLYFTGRLRARWIRLTSPATAAAAAATAAGRRLGGITGTPAPTCLRAGGTAGGSRLPLRLFTKGTDTGGTPLQGPLLARQAELWFRSADLYW